MGADFQQLIFQFLTEAILTTVIALIIGLMVAELLLTLHLMIFLRQIWNMRLRGLLRLESQPD